MHISCVHNMWYDVQTFIKIHFIGSLFSIGKEEWIGQVSASEVKQCGKYSEMRIN